MPELRRNPLPVSQDSSVAIADAPASAAVEIPPAVLTPGAPAPKVGFVSLGCPKALVDSEQILTQLRAEGYETAKSYAGADLVIVNTCGFIDAAVQESLDAIGEALAEHGKGIVTGCLGAKKDAAGDDILTKVHPKVLAVTGPHAVTEVMESVHLHLPKPHDPFIDLVPDHGVKLTPKHYAYLKISEGCNHRCSFCIIPSMRGDLVSRPIGDVLGEAARLFEAGVKELLVISQDTSAYGVDVKYRTGFWDGKPVKTRMLDLCQQLGELREERRARFMAVAEEVSAAKLRGRIGATMQVLVDAAPALGRRGGVGRSYADAPEIDGSVKILPPEKASKTLKVGEFARVRI